MELMVGASAPSGNGPEAGYGADCAHTPSLGPPRPVEAEVAIIWADVLGLDAVAHPLLEARHAHLDDGLVHKSPVAATSRSDNCPRDQAGEVLCK